MEYVYSNPEYVSKVNDFGDDYHKPESEYDAYDKEVTVWGRADLKDVDDANLGLKGSPTKIAKASDKVPKGAGEMLEGDSPETLVANLVGKFKERHII